MLIHYPWEGNMRNKLLATLLALPLLGVSLAAAAADPVVGRWKTIDDETGKAKSIVEITQAANGIEALAAYRAGHVDVMFLDLTMPDMDGYQVLETLRKEDLNCLVIVVSADIQEKAQERVLAMGAIAFIRKPITAEGLRDVLKQYGVVV